MVGLEYQGAEVAGVERERPVHRGAGSGGVLEAAAGIGEAEAGAGIRLAGGHDAFEGFARLARIASTQGLDAGPGKGAHVDGWRVHPAIIAAAAPIRNMRRLRDPEEGKIG